MGQQDTTEGMFGLAPWQIDQKRAVQDMEYAKAVSGMDALERGRMSMALGGRGLARLGASILGVPDSEKEEQAKKTEAMRGVSFNNPETMRAKANQIRESNPEIAAKLEQMANQREAEMSKQGLEAAQTKKALLPNWELKTIPVGDNTVQDIKVDATGQNPDQMVGKPRKMTDKDRASIKGESVQPLAYIDPVTGQAKWGTIGEARGKTPAQFDPITGQIMAAGKREGTEIGVQRSKIAMQEGASDSVNSALTLLDTGIYGGFYAEPKLLAARALGGKESKEKAARTQQFVSDVGNIVVPRLQEFGGNDSVEELRYLKGIMAGDISIESEATKAILKSAQKKIERGINYTKQGRTINGDIAATQRSVAANLTPKDTQALEWALKNPGDSRAAEIRKRLGR